ncbi:hypothetical protein NBRC116493_35890 [Aurantivibrio infirmus]
MKLYNVEKIRPWKFGFCMVLFCITLFSHASEFEQSGYIATINNFASSADSTFSTSWTSIQLTGLNADANCAGDDFGAGDLAELAFLDSETYMATILLTSYINGAKVTALIDDGSLLEGHCKIKRVSLSPASPNSSDPVNALARYWRIYITENNGGALTTVAELMFFDTDNNAFNLLASSAIFANSISNSLNPAHYAIDGSSLNKWTSAGATPNFVGFDFGAPVAIGSFMLMGNYSSGDQAHYAPKVFTIQYSNDNVVWTNHPTVFGDQTNWGAAEERIFTLDAN